MNLTNIKRKLEIYENRNQSMLKGIELLLNIGTAIIGLVIIYNIFL